MKIRHFEVEFGECYGVGLEARWTIEESVMYMRHSGSLKTLCVEMMRVGKESWNVQW